MQDHQVGGRVLELEAIHAVEPLPPIAPAPPLALGTRSVHCTDRSEPMPLADARAFCIELGTSALAAGDEQAVEHGKRRR